jgi:hypothetical protein
MVRNLESVGAQLAAGDASTPLLPEDPEWLSTPVTDPVVFGLCAKVGSGDSRLVLIFAKSSRT